MNILIFGDVVGRIGRRALATVLSQWKATYTPTLTVANVENLAHGAGISHPTITELVDLGVDVMTGGNHLWDKAAYMDVFADPNLARRIARPLNDVGVRPGNGVCTFEKEGHVFHVLNVMGQAFFKAEYTSPFEAIDTALASIPIETITLLDIHAETTSEKAVLGRYVDGRVSAVWGTHTHVPTADERLLPHGTAFVTDVGLTGAHNEAIGVSYELVLPRLKDGIKGYFTPPRFGPAEVNAILLTFEEGSRFPSAIERLRSLVEIPEDAS